MTPADAKARLRSLPDAVASEMASALDRVAQAAATEARRRLGAVGPSYPGDPPADPAGVLGQAIGTDRGPDEAARVVVPAAYAVDLEYGTARMAARPFLRPAVMATAEEARQMLADAFARAVAAHLDHSS